jgi:hypothetical protein
MTYKLAKQLKDAGFPPNGEGFWWVLDMDVWKLVDTYQLNFIAKQVSEKKGRVMPEHYRCPSLSELIEACVTNLPPVADKQFTLTFFMGEWHAFIPNIFTKHDLLEGFRGTGPTPVVAVANIWLAFQSKT